MSAILISNVDSLWTVRRVLHARESRQGERYRLRGMSVRAVQPTGNKIRLANAFDAEFCCTDGKVMAVCRVPIDSQEDEDAVDFEKFSSLRAIPSSVCSELEQLFDWRKINRDSRYPYCGPIALEIGLERGALIVGDSRTEFAYATGWPDHLVVFPSGTELATTPQVFNPVYLAMAQEILGPINSGAYACAAELKKSGKDVCWFTSMQSQFMGKIVVCIMPLHSADGQRFTHDPAGVRREVGQFFSATAKESKPIES